MAWCSKQRDREGSKAMKWKQASLLFVSMALLPVASALALEWTFCDTCTQPSQFATAAIAKVGSRLGEFDVYVGNRTSGRLHYVVISAHQSGSQPAGVGDISTDSAIEPGRSTEEPNLESQGGSVYEVLLNTRQSAAAEDQFMDIINSIKQGTVTVEDRGEPIVLPTQDGFGSFSGRNETLFRDYAWNHQGEPIYGVRPSEPLSENAITVLFVTAAEFNGSFTQCYIFNNGDIGCFKVPITPSDTAEFVTGTAVDRNGNSIPGTGSGGRGFQVIPDDNRSRYGPVGYASYGHFWKVCSFDEKGKVISCYVEWVRE